MLTSAGFPQDSVPNLKINTLWDGIFHAFTYIFVVVGLILLWRQAHEDTYGGLASCWQAQYCSGSAFSTSLKASLTIIYSASTTSTRPCQWIYWDVGFLIWGAVMTVVGWWLLRRGSVESPGERIRQH